jgi:hypothetical protein
MYKAIGQHRSVRKLYVEALVKRGDITLDEAEQALADFQGKLQVALDETRASAVPPVKAVKLSPPVPRKENVRDAMTAPRGRSEATSKVHQARRRTSHRTGHEPHQSQRRPFEDLQAHPLTLVGFFFGRMRSCGRSARERLTPTRAACSSSALPDRRPPTRRAFQARL